MVSPLLCGQFAPNSETGPEAGRGRQKRDLQASEGEDMSLKKRAFLTSLALSVGLVPVAVPAWAGICVPDSRTPGTCTYTAEQEGVHRIAIILPSPSPASIAGHACGKPVKQQDQGFQAVCYAYLNSGASYPVTASGQASVDVTPAEPAPGTVVVIP